MVTAVARKPARKKNFDHMLKRWCGIKEIEVHLLCEILPSKDTLQGQKTVASLLKVNNSCKTEPLIRKDSW